MNYIEKKLEVTVKKSLGIYKETNVFKIDNQSVILAKLNDVQNRLPYPLQKILKVNPDCFYSMLVARNNLEDIFNKLNEFESNADFKLDELFLTLIENKHVSAITFNSQCNLSKLSNIDKSKLNKFIYNLKMKLDIKYTNNLNIFRP